MRLTKEVVLANRQKWIDFLLNKRVRKTKGMLDDGKGGRCCLGHGCYALGVKRKCVKVPGTEGITEYSYEGETSYAPYSFQEMVGLIDQCGTFIDGPVNVYGFEVGTLADLNDMTKMRPWEIGVALADMIMGGKGTPFRDINYYPAE